MDYRQALDFLFSFPDMESGTAPVDRLSMSLESMKKLLALRGDPHKGRTTVHVTGSKGKGSTACMIESILTHAGYRTSLYTSPHMHRYHERIRIGSAAVSENSFAEAVGRIRHTALAQHHSKEGRLSTFGLMTLLFFELSRSQKASHQVVEVGLGGRMDATNVFDCKELAVITPISLEHAAILGDSPAAIAREKAGIITPGCTTVLAPQNAAGVREVIRQRCFEIGSSLIEVQDRYEIQPIEQTIAGQRFMLKGESGAQILETKMLGPHQLDNAATAVAAVRALAACGTSICAQAVASGLASACLPGRVEFIEQGKMFVLDGAHNADSARALVAAVRAHAAPRRCLYILGTNQDKDVEGIYRELTVIPSRIICTKSQNPRAMAPEALQELTNASWACKSVHEALELARAVAASDELICVTGSLYLVAEARSILLGLSSSHF